MNFFYRISIYKRYPSRYTTLKRRCMDVVTTSNVKTTSYQRCSDVVCRLGKQRQILKTRQETADSFIFLYLLIRLYRELYVVCCNFVFIANIRIFLERLCIVKQSIEVLYQLSQCSAGRNFHIINIFQCVIIICQKKHDMCESGH